MLCRHVCLIPLASSLYRVAQTTPLDCGADCRCLTDTKVTNKSYKAACDADEGGCWVQPSIAWCQTQRDVDLVRTSPTQRVKSSLRYEICAVQSVSELYLGQTFDKNAVTTNLTCEIYHLRLPTWHAMSAQMRMIATRLIWRSTRQCCASL